MKNINISSIFFRLAINEKLHVYKQTFATFASCLLFMTSGVTFGYTGVLLPQLRGDPEYPYDKNLDSWIASISPLAMMVGCIGSGIMSDILGRKTGQLVIIFPFIAGWIIMSFAENNAIMLLGRFITGLCTGAVRPTTMVYIGELISPKYRGVALSCPTLAVHIGSLISHFVGYVFYWRTSCLIFGAPNIICFLILLSLTESPLWLISKGKTEEGVKSFKAFRGEGETAVTELALVLESKDKNPENMSFKEKMNVLFSKPFFKAIFTVFLLFVSMQLCGVNMISFYAQEIFKSTFKGEVDEYMLMIVTDCIRVLTTAAVCVFSRFLPRRLTYLVNCFGTVAVLIGLTIYLYLKPQGLVWLGIILMIGFIVIASIVTSISWSFVTEIFPVNLRGFGSGLSSCISFSLLFVSVKITPGIMYTYGEVALYGFFAVVTLISTVFLSFVLPETNNKSLQDLENNMYKNNEKQEELDNVTTKF